MAGTVDEDRWLDRVEHGSLGQCDGEVGLLFNVATHEGEGVTGYFADLELRLKEGF